jgi:apolipoprotein N-acyltransferase
MNTASIISNIGNLSKQASALRTYIVRAPALTYLACLSLGAITVLAYAPFNFFLIPIFTLAVLMEIVLSQATAGRAAKAAFFYGLGMFGAGVSWIYVSLHIYGGMPAALAVLATLMFCGFLSLFPALFGALCWYVRRSNTFLSLLILPALWVGSEWLRGVLFTGFPWLVFGYSQIPDSLLSGYAPVLGVYGVSALIALSAALLRRLFISGVPKTMPVLLLLVVWGIGGLLRGVTWTSPVGAPFAVALLQGNVPQDQKWRSDQLDATLDSYRRLVEKSDARLIILPETAIPLFTDQLSTRYAADLSELASAKNADLIMGIVERKSQDGQIRYYNSAISTGVSPSQTYRKHHLVPFGEYIPAKPLFSWVLNVLHIPLTDMSSGGKSQLPLHLAGQRVAVNICFEDVFGEEIIRSLPEATVLVNLSNIAWFGDSLALPQHLQISQMRALETGRYMLRATNTGVTAIINDRGKIMHQVRAHETAILTGVAQGFTGTTPYARLGNLPILLFSGLGVLFMLCALLRKELAAECKDRKGFRKKARTP